MNNLNKICETALKASEESNLYNLLTDSFMQQYSNFSTLDEFFKACGIDLEKGLKVEIDTLNRIVSENTIFSTFIEMMLQAQVKRISTTTENTFK